MELRWLEDPETKVRRLQYRSRGDNGIIGPGYECYDTGWTDVPVEVDVPTVTDNVSLHDLPVNCRERLRLEGKAYPKSGCAICGDGGIKGCPYETIRLKGGSGGTV